MSYLAGNYSDHCERPTHSEHTARAMLMGRVYDWRDGTYCLLFQGGVVTTPVGDGAIDCLTCEEITEGELASRKGYGWLTPSNDWKVPTEPTPWAKLG